jgi:uncharacterized membrane protein
VEKVIPKKQSMKQAGVAIVICHKTDIRQKLVRRHNEGHFILIKGTVHQEGIIIVNIYELNMNTPKTLMDRVMFQKHR